MEMFESDKIRFILHANWMNLFTYDDPARVTKRTLSSLFIWGLRTARKFRVKDPAEFRISLTILRW